MDGVRCVLLTPESLDEVLPRGGSRSRAPRPSLPWRCSPIGRAFPPLAEGVPLPVARLSYSALESYKRCGYRFYLERVVKMPRVQAELVAPPLRRGGRLGPALARRRATWYPMRSRP